MVPDTENSRLTFFSFESKLIKSIALKSLRLLETIIDSNGDIIGLAIVREEENPRHELKKFDYDLKYLYSFAYSPIQNPRNLNPYMPALVWGIDKKE